MDGHEPQQRGTDLANLRPESPAVWDDSHMLLLVLLGVGLAAGWMAQVLAGDRRRINWTVALVTGVVGSLIGGLIISLLLGNGLQLQPSGIVGSILGAVIVLAGYRAISGSSSSPSKNRKAPQKSRR